MVKCAPSYLVLLSAFFKLSSCAVPKIRTSLAPLNASEQNEFNIPHTLWFNHNFSRALEIKAEPFDIFENVADIIDKHHQWWGDPVGLKFIDEPICRTAIVRAEAKLLPYFESEEFGAHREKLCRTAVLYVWGGYYFDTDVVVVNHVQPRNSTRFIAVLGCGGSCLSHAFLASAPGHPILERTLTNILDIYESNKDATMLALVTMANVYHSLPESEREDIEIVRLNFGHILDHEQHPFQGGGQGDKDEAENTGKYFIDIDNPVGSGRGGKVVRAIAREADEPDVMIKCITGVNQGRVQNIKREESILKELGKHPKPYLPAYVNLGKNVTRSVRSALSSPYGCYGMTSLQGSTGLSWYEKVRHSGDSTELQFVLSQLLIILRQLSRLRIFHGDLHLKNLLIDGNKRLSIIDFGLGQLNQENAEELNVRDMIRRLLNEVTLPKGLDWLDFARQALKKDSHAHVKIPSLQELMECDYFSNVEFDKLEERMNSGFSA